MEKPIVFLSHSSKDKRVLIALKKLLEKNTVGALKFFLSSDGESIPLGTSWVHRIVDSLKNSKLMFVFVSQESLKSGWIFFEAGYSFGRDLHVVPCCLPGVELKQLPPPLSLLQAQTLHSAQDINRVIAKCNEIFALQIPERVSKKDFDEVFRLKTNEPAIAPIIPWQKLIQDIRLKIVGPPAGLEAFVSLCRRKKIQTHQQGHHGWESKQWHAPGMTIREFEEWYEDYPHHRKVSGKEKKEGEPESRQYEFIFAPELFHLNAPLFDSWRKKLKVPRYTSAEMEFSLHYDIEIERVPHRLTTKLYESEIEMIKGGWFRIAGTDFVTNDERMRHFHILFHSKLGEMPIGEFLSILAQREILLLPKSMLKTMPKR